MNSVNFRNENGPLPRLGTKVTFDGVEGRVSGFIIGRHKDASRSVVVELKRGYFAKTGQHNSDWCGSAFDTFISAQVVHASNLLNADGEREWARQDEVLS
jgi:hypothetical protein